MLKNNGKIMNPKEDPGLLEILPEIFNKSFNAIIVFQPLRNPKGEIVDFIYRYMNDTCFKFLKGHQENYIGKRYLELFPNAVEAGIFDLYKSVAETGNIAEQDMYYEDNEIKGWFKNSVLQLRSNIVVFFRDISENKKLELQLTKSLQEKELLIKEIHHRVKNSLQIISSILNIQSSYSEDPEVSKLFIDSQNRIKAVALIHQKLFEGSPSIFSISLGTYVEDLVNAIQATLQQKKEDITIKCHLGNMEVQANTAISLGLVLNELITNAIKYAFPSQILKEIKIIIENNGHLVKAIIEDNGVGFPEHIDFRSTGTIGMLLVDAFVRQLEGNIELDRSNGTKFTITFTETMLKSKSA